MSRARSTPGTLAEPLPDAERLDGFVEPRGLMIDLLVDDARAIGRSSGKARDVPVPLAEEAIDEVGISEQDPQLCLSGLSPVKVSVDLRRHPDGWFPVRVGHDRLIALVAWPLKLPKQAAQLLNSLGGAVAGTKYHQASLA